MDLTKAGGQAADYVAQGSAVNGIAAVTAPGKVGARFYVTGISISSNGAVAVSVECTLKDAASAYLDGFQIPASAFIPIIVNYNNHPLVGPVNSTITLTLPALGAAITGEVVLKGFYA